MRTLTHYLAHKAQSVGYLPQVILSGRRVNDQMGAFVASRVVKLLIQKDHKIKDSQALIMGITFKENCPDIRNTRVIDIFTTSWSNSDLRWIFTTPGRTRRK